ncbi:hypothetical protein MATL_G00086690 [Megalops atlanticus]|uniref:SCP domain-containing protein n=1 Tax=Megalops atlanticus TaxID=7932 RepID=A0A9D3Q5J3_MEGAT|nr:hypothetical protein MATL_G00086690 [Megalops atlanticus]
MPGTATHADEGTPVWTVDVYLSYFYTWSSKEDLNDGSFEVEFLERHNTYRADHGAPPLTLSRDLCKTAQEWADHIMSTKTLQHSDTENGENLYYAFSSSKKTLNGKEAVDSWYSEIKNYDFSKPGPSRGKPVGHFTQVVWKSTREVGVGLATDGHTVFVVGQYSPAGNITNKGYHDKNVLPKGSQLQAGGEQRSGKKEQDKRKGGGADASFEAEFLERHNTYRADHGAPPLTLSRDLCRTAQEWADHIMSTQTLQHSDTENGENLYYAFSSSKRTLNGKEAVDSWYSEVKDYDFSKPGPSRGKPVGHFTQVVWKSSKEVGVGLATDGHTVFVVGQYSPAGNITNEDYYEKNVLPKDSSAFLSEFLQECNKRREEHGAEPLSLSSTLCQEAQAWAEALVKQRVLRQSSAEYGQNIWGVSGDPEITVSGKEIVEKWYNGADNYDFKKPGPQAKTGYFTQLVWCGSKEVGIGKANNGKGNIIIVAYFQPGGNITNHGYYARNVLPKGSKVKKQPS